MVFLNAVNVIIYKILRATDCTNFLLGSRP